MSLWFIRISESGLLYSRPNSGSFGRTSGSLHYTIITHTYIYIYIYIYIIKHRILTRILGGCTPSWGSFSLSIILRSSTPEFLTQMNPVLDFRWVHTGVGLIFSEYHIEVLSNPEYLTFKLLIQTKTHKYSVDQVYFLT